MNECVYIILLYSDRDECEHDEDNCADACDNTAGSYICSCSPGYKLHSDGHNCTGEYSWRIYVCGLLG